MARNARPSARLEAPAIVERSMTGEIILKASSVAFVIATFAYAFYINL